MDELVSKTEGGDKLEQASLIHKNNVFLGKIQSV